MVLQMGHHASSRPDATRIAGISGTLVLNTVLFLVLLAPLSRPDILVRLPDLTPDFHWVVPKPKPPEVPPELEVVKPNTPARSERVTPSRPVDAPPVAEQAVVDEGSIAVEETMATPAGDIAPAAEGGAAAGMRLEYDNASAPPYPRGPLLAGIQGTVLLKVRVGVDGSPLEVSIHHSSGNRQLDDAARRHVLRHWRFRPAMQDGRAIPAVGIVPIDFRLDRS